ncbi:MAG: glycoside hydrolase family 2 TIM barrel-domain containing protein, partial [Endomicrobiia bacterium]
IGRNLEIAFMLKKKNMCKRFYLCSFILVIVSFLQATQISFKLYDEGKEEIVEYEKYGEFVNIGTEKYKYIIRDKKGLSNAVGEGIFPNTESILRDPNYQRLKNSGALDGSHWDFVNITDYEASFYKWATTSEDPGVKLFYIALALEKAGLLKHAIKAYYAIVVHFPNTIGWTYWKTPWYIGPVAIDKIIYLTRRYPELGMKIEGAKIIVKNKFDNNVRNDIFIVNPGKIVKCKPDEVIKKIDISKLKIKKQTGKENIKLIQYGNGHWQLLVNNKPFLVKGIAYSPSKVGRSPDTGTLIVHRDWMFDDYNKNGKIDGPYDSWVDRNENNNQDKDEPIVGDFQLMKDIGVNTIRLYHHAYNKPLLRDLHESYGIMVLMGDYLGMYATGSGAGWYEGTDYTNPVHCKNMLESVKEMVLEFKDEPYVLMWVLGNENNYAEVGDATKVGSGCRAKEQPEAYYKFVNEAAKLIKSLDPYQRPVAICNGDLLYLDYFAKYCPDVDVFGANVYRGPHGFGYSLWSDVKDLCNKPVLITEYGCPAYGKGFSKEKIEELQAEYHKYNWLDIYYNSAGYGVGNALGGVTFEFVDEWWKGGPPPQFDPSVQETVGSFGGPFLDGRSYEEWYGICSQGNGKNSPFLRQLRKSYFVYQELWK